MEWCSVWEPGLPLSPGAIDQADQQQLLGDYPGVLWAAGSIPPPLAFILDLNTRLFVYLRTIEFPGGNDLTTMLTKSLASRLGDANARFHALVEDATP